MYIHIQPWFYWIVTAGGMITASTILVRSFARQAGVAVAIVIACILALWGTAVACAGALGVFQYGARFPVPFIGIAVAGPLVLSSLLLGTSRSARAAVGSIPLSELTIVQAVRVLGFTFLLQVLGGSLPPLFAVPAGIGDMLVGATAMGVARSLAAKAPGSRRAAQLWNAFGILDLAVALTIGFFSSDTPLRLFHTVPSTDALTALPTVLVPAFGVPLFLVLHGISLARLRPSPVQSRSSRAA